MTFRLEDHPESGRVLVFVDEHLVTEVSYADLNFCVAHPGAALIPLRASSAPF